MSRENPKEKYLTSVGKAVDYQILKEDAGKNFYSTARNTDFTLPDSTADAEVVGFSCSVSNAAGQTTSVYRGGSTDQILYLGGLSNSVTVANAGDTLEFYCVTQGTWVVMQKPPLIHAGSHATGGYDALSPTSIGAVAENANVKFTDDGGLATSLVAGEALYQGEVVCVIQTGGGGSADNTVMKCPTSGSEQSMPIGVVLAYAAASDPVWVVVAGKAYVLPESGITAARGNVIYTSASAAGRAGQSATIPTNEHWREVGHFVANGTGNGVATLAVLHFN